jgi:hypothetical protein
VILGLLAWAFITYVFVLFLRMLFGDTFHSAFLSPYRRYARLLGSLQSVLPGMATYVVRRKGWSVLRAMIMGLERYPYPVPIVERQPNYATEVSVKYEDIPKGAQQRALERRSAWVARHLGDASETFSKLAVTAADITSLVHMVEADQTLVHAAYYTDDECIARIADWIADKG